MTVTLFVVLMAVAYIAAAASIWYRSRGVRVVRCPATRQAARIELASARAGLLLTPLAQVPVRRCTLWPERRDCAQWCCDEIELSPHGCRMEGILADWYQTKRCAFCGRTVPRPALGEIKPALRAPDGHVVEWSDIEPARLFDVLVTHQPVCASCDVAETFRSRYADWVVERPRPTVRPPT